MFIVQPSRGGIAIFAFISLWPLLATTAVESNSSDIEASTTLSSGKPENMQLNKVFEEVNNTGITVIETNSTADDNHSLNDLPNFDILERETNEKKMLPLKIEDDPFKMNHHLPFFDPFFFLPSLPFLHPKDMKENFNSEKDSDVSTNPTNPLTLKDDQKSSKPKPFLFFYFAANIRDVPMSNITKDEKKNVSVDGNSTENFTSDDKGQTIVKFIEDKEEILKESLFDPAPFLPINHDLFFPELTFHKELKKKMSKHKRSNGGKKENKKRVNILEESLQGMKETPDKKLPLLKYLKDSKTKLVNEGKNLISSDSKKDIKKGKLSPSKKKAKGKAKIVQNSREKLKGDGFTYPTNTVQKTSAPLLNDKISHDVFLLAKAPNPNEEERKLKVKRSLETFQKFTTLGKDKRNLNNEENEELVKPSNNSPLPNSEVQNRNFRNMQTELSTNSNDFYNEEPGFEEKGNAVEDIFYSIPLGEKVKKYIQPDFTAIALPTVVVFTLVLVVCFFLTLTRGPVCKLLFRH